ncbi:MAG: AAA family ATPase [Candidatus Aminicenantes bacterium]|nr:AAA family ATPase [Candidatus Aminicenantes bacterium]NIM77563.1 AAA family ATPase [Candidatus Aminicenantes bacterium]NIN16885.1 AAA family ATPase [Candidatus Aminicenantes bacterium]NIN40773.1 AAA family ATPase [Candidatus Aminicenantes bacterium]NIN83582.1 AAA family ATPase [Candidatus Aminicenantes bacterium]
MLYRVYQDLAKFLKKKKALILYGARQVGTTTLLENFLKTSDFKYKLESGDNIRVKDILGSQDFARILEYISGYELFAVDEAQEIPGIGKALKIIIDQSPDIYLIATGSSSFELSQEVGEPLTGRKRVLVLFPLSQRELLHHYNKFELRERLENFLIYGSYPEVLSTENNREKIEILKEIVESYLLKDILKLDKVRSPNVLMKLLKLLAFQVGSEVSMNELAMNVKVDVKTIARYLDLLEKSFVIIRLGGFSKNLRKEVVSMGKYYFLDNGIRNAVISQFNPLEDRNDTGALFENFVIMERQKKHEYENFYGSHYFWRTYGGQEIDLVEEIDGKLSGFEIKWSPKKKVKIPGDWAASYEGAGFNVINRENYLDFLL